MNCRAHLLLSEDMQFAGRAAGASDGRNGRSGGTDNRARGCLPVADLCDVSLCRLSQALVLTLLGVTSINETRGSVGPPWY